MMKSKQKYYVVWKGVNPGVYRSWTDCLLQIQNYAGALHKSYKSEAEAQEAFASSPWECLGIQPATKKQTFRPSYITESLAVDAACSGNPGKMEYRGVYVNTGQQAFRIGPLKQGTNNVGEFLAVVHGLALCKLNGWTMPIYTDSLNALSWVKHERCNTNLTRTDANVPIFDLIARAERWLRSNSYPNRILKWETSFWGENPADFGRK